MLNSSNILTEKDIAYLDIVFQRISNKMDKNNLLIVELKSSWLRGNKTFSLSICDPFNSLFMIYYRLSFVNSCQIVLLLHFVICWIVFLLGFVMG